MRTNSCRLCRASDLQVVIDLGYHPLADTFLIPEQLNEPETRYPLRVLLCASCGALMSEYVVSAEERYQKHEYSYDSSNSPIAVRHFQELAEKMCSSTPLADKDLVVDIGSNVGTLLGHLKEYGARVLGIEPSNLAIVANERGVKTIKEFFGTQVAKTAVEKYGQAKAMVATNVFNHIGDVDGFFEAVETFLQDDGVLFLEIPYVPDLIEKTAFDTIYLEHVSYFAVTPFVTYAAKRGWYIYHLETNEYMGGSILVAMGRDKGREDTVGIEAHRARESELGIARLATYQSFMERARSLKANLLHTLAELKRDGKHVAGLGAATKGNTLLNYCGIDKDTMDCVLESSPFKIGKYTPGSHIPITDEKEMNSRITHLVILPWNIGEYLKQKLGHLPVEFIIPHT